MYGRKISENDSYVKERNMQTFAMGQQNPFQSSVVLFEGLSKIKNVITNDYFSINSSLNLKAIPISSFLSLIKQKYSSEYSSIYDIVECFKICSQQLFKNRMIPCLDNLRMFSEHLLRHSEILVRLSSHNNSTTRMPLNDVCIGLMKRTKWVDIFYSQITSMYANRDFRPLVDNFYEAQRIDPFDLTIVGLSLPQNFCRSKTIAFDTAYNCKDMYKQRLQFLPSVLSSKICTDIDYVLSFCNVNEYATVTKNVDSGFISKSNDLYEAANDYLPFIETGGYYYTNANFVARYIANHTSSICEKNKKYLIHSGFMFEKRMKNDYDKNKFDLIDIKRTKTHREFDVILKDKGNGNILNIQCKNFAIDLYHYRKDISFAQRRLSRVMKRLEAALRKEIEREPQLVAELQLRKISFNAIRHIVVSKQQIPSNDDIMDYSHFLEKYG